MRIFLFPFAFIYSLIARLRRFLYNDGLIKKTKLPKPVISVGNLTVGGTGKTPVVDILMSQFEAKGLKVGVLTRGYGRQKTEPVLVSAESRPEDVGDEPLWLYKRHPNAKIVVAAERAKAALSAGDVDLFILDDGLQHLGIERDFEIVLIDATKPDWVYKPLPQGLARESFDVIKYADLVVLTRCNQTTIERVDETSLRALDCGVADISESDVLFDTCEDLLSGNTVFLKDQVALLVSAIANPESFEKLVKETFKSLIVKEHKIFSDHFSYEPKDIKEILQKAKSVEATLILTTEKDAVKLADLTKRKSINWNIPLGVVKTQLTFDPPLPDVYDLVCYTQH